MKTVFIPDGTREDTALARTTHLCIAAHQDDIEFMAYAPVAECFEKKDKWFCGVVVTDGAGSPRSGAYANYTDEEMKAVRAEEQKKAAVIGGYGALAMLNFSSAQVKANGREVAEELADVLKKTKPQYVYTHNLADKHETHVATALRTIAALRLLNRNEVPRKVYGCEVWRSLDWLDDEEKIFLDCSAHPNLSRALSSVFDSQIAGGKRYDLAAEGRRLANATFSESHACDKYTMLNYAMDLTPLVLDATLDISGYAAGYVQRFRERVTGTLKKFL